MNGKHQLWLLFRAATRGRRRSAPGKRPVAARAADITGTAVMCLLLAAFGTGMGLFAQSEGATVIFGFMPFILLGDFAMRFALQQSVTDIRPFSILPVRRRTVAAAVLLAAVTDGYSLAWFCLFVPYAATVLAVGGCGLATATGITLTCALVMLANNLWYVFVRLLTSLSSAWWWLPAAIYSSALMAGIAGSQTSASYTIMSLGRDFGFTPQAIALYAMLAAVLWFADRALMLRTARADGTHKPEHHALHGNLNAIGRRGLTGEYIKLEIRCIMRNRTLKRNFVQGLLFMAMIAIVMPVLMSHDGYISIIPFWCMYCFMFFAMTILVKVMEPEGNYINLLMTRRESLLALLEAKYRFYSALLILPLAAMVPAVITGTVAWLFVIACLFTTTGPAHFVLFQLAVSNNRTMQLDGKADGKSRRNSTRQAVSVFIVLIVPLTVMYVLRAWLGSTAAYCTMIVLGSALTATHRLWLANIYQRMMKRKYENIENFRVSKT